MAAPAADYKLKFIIIGSVGVGKSSLLRVFTEGSFSGRQEPTIGVEFASKTIDVDGTSVKMVCWDTAGQESFRSITHSYYRNAHVAILVYDASARDTFEQLSFWLEELRGRGPTELVIALAANKVDLAEREVSRDEGEAFAARNDLLYLETSARTEYNVDSAFEESARRVLEKVRAGTMHVDSTASSYKSLSSSFAMHGGSPMRGAGVGGGAGGGGSSSASSQLSGMPPYAAGVAGGGGRIIDPAAPPPPSANEDKCPC